MRRINQYATLLWLIPPLLSYAPPTKRLADPSTARACMRTPTLAGHLLTTAPILCPEDHPCWDVHQRVIFISWNYRRMCSLVWQKVTYCEDLKDVGWEKDYIFICCSIPNKAWLNLQVIFWVNVGTFWFKVKREIQVTFYFFSINKAGLKWWALRQ